MNERIKELAEQAEVWKGVYTGFVFDKEKFAELIFRECIEQVDQAIPDTECEASGTYRTAKIAAIGRIKKHFGVEE